MLDARLYILALIRVESDILRQLKYEYIIQDFITIKDRRKEIGH